MGVESSGSTRSDDGRRTLGRSGIEVGALGFRCWAIGGEWARPDGQPLGWGKVDESVRVIRRALDSPASARSHRWRRTRAHPAKARSPHGS